MNPQPGPPSRGNPKKGRNKPRAEKGGGGGPLLPELDGTHTARIGEASGPVRIPSSSGTETPSKQAYAGPTFHASPAPASLPIPKFFSKPGSSGGAHESLQDHLATDLDRSNASTPQAGTTSPPVHRNDSPLDFLFNAQKQERERALSNKDQGSSSDRPSWNSSPSPFQPRTTSIQPSMFASPPMSGKDALKMETESPSNGHRNIDTSNMVSFQDRIGALRTSSATQGPDVDGEELRQKKTDDLKRLLFAQPHASSSTPPGGFQSLDGNSLFPPSHNNQPMNRNPYGNSAPDSPTLAPFNATSLEQRSQHLEYGAPHHSDDASPRRKDRRHHRPSNSHQRTAMINASRVAELPAPQVPFTTQQTQQQPGATQDTSNVKAMEDSLKRMLKMQD